jgi:hypothetical protein
LSALPARRVACDVVARAADDLDLSDEIIDDVRATLTAD